MSSITPAVFASSEREPAPGLREEWLETAGCADPVPSNPCTEGAAGSKYLHFKNTEGRTVTIRGVRRQVRGHMVVGEREGGPVATLLDGESTFWRFNPGGELPGDVYLVHEFP